MNSTQKNAIFLGKLSRYCIASCVAEFYSLMTNIYCCLAFYDYNARAGVITTHFFTTTNNTN